MNIIKSSIRILKQLNYIINKEQKVKAIGVLFTMIVCSFLELLGVTILIPFLSLMTDEASLKSKWYISWFYDLYPNITRVEMVVILCVVFMLVYILKNLFMTYSAYIQARYASDFNKDNAIRMLESYMKRPYEYFTYTNSSIMTRGINSDVVGVYNILLDMFVIVSELFTIASIGIFLIMMDWVIAITSLLLASTCMLIIVFVFKNRMKKAGKVHQEAASRRGMTSYQAITGIKEITVLDRRKQFVDAFEKATEVERKASIVRTFLSACPDRLIEAVCISGFMIVVCIRVVAADDFASFVPILGTFAMGAFRVLPSFAKISSRVNDMVFFIPCVQNCYDIISEAAIYEKEKIENEDLIDGVLSFNESVELKNVSWKYTNTDRNVLDDISMSIGKGESIAFIGPSGAGKSTLADIIMGLFVPQCGTVEMDGVSIYDIPHKWSKIIGYVPQTVYLIDDTIKKNVAFGLSDDDIDDAKIWRALEQAQVKKYVESLPDGLNTMVGERGVKFSGGQRQRVAIARALYENPDIIVLDEATSALDNETETAVMEAINSLQGIKTLIIIAHRLSTIKNCDKVYKVSDGKVILQEKDKI